MYRNKLLLFSDGDLSDVLRQQTAAALQAVDDIPPDQVRTEDPEDLIRPVIHGYQVDPLELHEDEISVEKVEEKIDVRGDPDRVIVDPNRPVLLDGIVVTYYVPFSGEADLFRYRPSTYTLNPPRAAAIDGHELVFRFERPDQDVKATKQDFDEHLSPVRQWIGWVNEAVEQFQGQLPGELLRRVQQRREQLAQTDDDLEDLGFKIRKRQQEDESRTRQPVSPSRRRPPKTTKKQTRETTFEYDVALSYAGEDREYVETVAKRLKGAKVRVFYDGFEKVKLWGRDLIEYLAKVYGKTSRFVILFVSEPYARKAWPKRERQEALARALKEHDKLVVLPARFDDTELSGLPDTVAYVDLRDYTPEQFADLILEKVRLEG